jgi:carbohydrate-selective porin OprB
MRYGLCLGAAALACGWSGVYTTASAQGTPTGGIPMFDSITAMGQAMAKSGIYFSLGYVEDISVLASGGQPGHTGTYPIGHATAGVTFDLETMAGLTGSSLHVIVEERNGSGLGGPSGIGSVPIQADAGPVKYRLTQFFWEQAIDHDRIDIQVGRTEPTLEFAVSDISCVFVSSIICAQPGTWYFSNANGAYPASEWGGRVNLAVTPEVYIKAGVYDDDPGSNGFMSAGLDWNTSKSTGVFSIAEVGYLTGFTSVELPAKYDAGFYYDTSHYTRGSQSGAPGVQGRDAAYVQAQQTVWRPDRATNQSITLFGGAILYNNNAPYRGQYYAGLYDRAPLGALRPTDALGLIGTLVDINTNATGARHDQEWIFEANYGIGLAPGVTVKPYVQYVSNPFNQGAPNANFKNDLIAGVQLSIALEQLLGFPVFAPH